jgi:uncharacterized membrane protein YfcA
MEDPKEIPSKEEEPDTVDSDFDKRRQRAWRWQIFGWAVIGLMIASVILNLMNVLTPEINKYLLGVLVAAYGVYIFFRRR